jgi:glycosyltransferase involved in cell wall biosynthesis
MDKVSIIIPTRSNRFIRQTVDDILKNAKGDIEVIVMLDGYWPDPPLCQNKNLTIVHKGQVQGMRKNVNAAVRIANGKYIMKSDDHCKFDEGFDEKLKLDCEENWLSVPSRYKLRARNWEREESRPINYMTLSFPYNTDTKKGNGLHDVKWKGKNGNEGSDYYMERARKDILIDDILAFQGSCWFMHKKKFIEIDGLMETTLRQEAEELGLKVWLSGGRVVRNKKTWYAHLHKGKKYHESFRLSKRHLIETEMFYNDFWMNNKWEKQTKTIEWLINKFWPMGWPDDWQDQKYQREYVHPADNLLTKWKAGNGHLPRY